MRLILIIILFFSKIIYSGYLPSDYIDEMTCRIKEIPVKTINMTSQYLLPSKVQKWLQSKWGISVNIYEQLTTKNTIKLPILNCFIEPSNTTHHGTQTEYHGYNNFAALLALLQRYKNRFQNPCFQTIINQAFTKELEEHKKGNYVFWHGRRYEWDYCAYLYKNIYNLTAKKDAQVDDSYTFLRFDNSTGSYIDYIVDFNNCNRITDGLFLCSSLFGCSDLDHWGQSAIQLVLKNRDWSENKIAKFSSEYILSRFNLKHYYTKYAADFTKLEQLHKAANALNFGNLLMIVTDDENINRIYSSHDYANCKCEIEIGNENTSAAKRIIEGIKTNSLKDSDHLQYVLPLTKDYALNPQVGPRIYSFNATDPVKRKEFEDFGAALFAKIAADLNVN